MREILEQPFGEELIIRVRESGTNRLLSTRTLRFGWSDKPVPWRGLSAGKVNVSFIESKYVEPKPDSKIDRHSILNLTVPKRSP